MELKKRGRAIGTLLSVVNYLHLSTLQSYKFNLNLQNYLSVIIILRLLKYTTSRKNHCERPFALW